VFQVGSIDSSWKCPGTQSIDERVAAPEIETEGGAGRWNRCASLKTKEKIVDKSHIWVASPFAAPFVPDLSP
jgi:hypothetical protein